MKLVEFRCLKKNNGTYAVCGLTAETLSKKTIMKKVKKMYPVIISENEYNEMKAGNFSVLSCSDYYEREEKTKTPKKQKIADEKMITSFIPKKGNMIMVSFETETGKAYVSDSYRVYISTIENVKTVLSDKGFKFENDTLLYNFNYKKEKNNREGVKVETFKKFLENCNDQFNTEFINNESYNPQEKDSFSSYFHAANRFFSPNMIIPFEKCDIDFSAAYCNLDSKTKATCFKNKAGETVYMILPLKIYDPKILAIKETKKINESKEIEVNNETLKKFSSIYSFLYENYQKNNYCYSKSVKKAIEELEINNSFYIFAKKLSKIREDWYTSDREYLAVYFLYMHESNQIENDFQKEVCEKALKEPKKTENQKHKENHETVVNNSNVYTKKIKKTESVQKAEEKTPVQEEREPVQEVQEVQGKPLSATSATVPTSSPVKAPVSPVQPIMKEKKKDSFCDVLESETLSTTTAYIGLSADEKAPVLLDFKKAIHCLVAGATGSGKSVMLHSIISSLMYSNTAETAQFLLIDPKRVEFFDYSDSPMLYGGKVYENVQESITALEQITYEMNDRYIQLKYAQSRSIDDLPPCAKMSRIYVVIDELSFLMLEDKKKIEQIISKIGMLGRAAGIHLILATQHPDRHTITGTIQANIPTVIGLATRKAVDSRMITGNNACTQLKGRGDAILIDGMNEVHFQGVFVSADGIHKIVNNQQKQTAAYIPSHVAEKIKNYQKFRS